MKYVYLLESRLCEYHQPTIVLGVFSSGDQAYQYVKSNFYLVDGEHDLNISDLPTEGLVFKQLGYNVRPDEMYEDEKGLYHLSQYGEECLAFGCEESELTEDDHKEHVTTMTSYTIRGMTLDYLVKWIK